MHLKPGTLLQSGKYRIVRFINSGGFGCTYEAVHTSLDDRFAIKEFFVKDFCNRDENTSYVTVGTNSKKALVEKLKNKFIKEAKSIRKLHHNGIVKVSDVFEENGTAYYVMDYIEGRSLSQLIDEKGRLTETETMRYIRKISETLKYVHSKNMLHLDIKPGNIMIDEEDNPILIDFGTSKQYDEESGENTSTLLGKTPGYAPLEQMDNSVQEFYPATDIYALGATMYKMLTGITPPNAIKRASGTKLEPLPSNISEGTRNAIETSLKILVENRPQSIEEFLKVLEIDGEKTDVIVPEPPAPKFNKKWIWRIICLSCVLFHVFTLVNDGRAYSSPFYPHELLFVILALTMILALVSLFKMGIKTKSKIKDRIIKTVLLLALLSGGGFVLWWSLFDADYYVYRGDEVWGERTLAYDKDVWDHRYKDNLIPIYKRSKGGYGLVNGLTAEVVIPYRYDYMSGYDIRNDCKFIGVELSDKCGVIDRKGNVIIPCVYDNIVNAGSLSVYGVSRVEKAGKWGLINTDGDVILPIVYDRVENVNEQTKTIRISKDKKYGLVNLNGKIIIPLEYDDIDDFKEGRASVEVDGKWGFIDKNNNMVIPCKYEWVSDFNGGQASVETFAGEKYKIDKQGRRI